MEQPALEHDIAELDALDTRINALLPPSYRGCYASVSPTSMGSASLKYGDDGRVAWDEIWTSYCDLALAGGPPHRGTWLNPATPEEAAADSETYQTVVEEIGRGIWMVTGLNVLPRVAPGWVGVLCRTETMASWLVRAIAAENVSARCEGTLLYLPAGPQFRLAKEIKNVVTSVAKTCHHWTDHMSRGQQAAVAAAMDTLSTGPLLQPASATEIGAALTAYHATVEAINHAIQTETGLPPAGCSAAGWIGFQCDNDEMAVWLLRAVIVENILARREANVLFLPARPRFTRNDVDRIVAVLARARRLWNLYQSRPGDPT